MSMPSQIATQFCVSLENKPGALAKMCADLHKADVNLLGLSIVESTDAGWIRLCAQPGPKAKAALKDRGYHFTTQKVLVLRPLNRPGELEKIARKLARAGVNINYLYGTSGIASSSTIVLNVSDVDKAQKTLE
ncbi:MAG: hypothetical protein ACF8R7_13015 [Phycisphaerales bacterium JB039]